MQRKSKTTALILSIFLGGLGVDRFYLGYAGIGVLKLLTGGCFGILALIDIINIATGKLKPADGNGYDEEFTASAPQQKSDTNPYDELEKASTLHKQGVLTDEEFAELKNKLMGQM